jgi:hypothetical protein
MISSPVHWLTPGQFFTASTIILVEFHDDAQYLQAAFESHRLAFRGGKHRVVRAAPGEMDITHPRGGQPPGGNLMILL